MEAVNHTNGLWKALLSFINNLCNPCLVRKMYFVAWYLTIAWQLHEKPHTLSTVQLQITY